MVAGHCATERDRFLGFWEGLGGAVSPNVPKCPVLWSSCQNIAFISISLDFAVAYAMSRLSLDGTGWDIEERQPDEASRLRDLIRPAWRQGTGGPCATADDPGGQARLGLSLALACSLNSRSPDGFEEVSQWRVIGGLWAARTGEVHVANGFEIVFDDLLIGHQGSTGLGVSLPRMRDRMSSGPRARHLVATQHRRFSKIQ